MAAADTARAFLGVGWAFPPAFAPTGQIVEAVYEDDVRQAITIILSTNPGERVMRPDTRPQGVQFTAQGNAVQLTYRGGDRPDGKASRIQTFRYVCLPAGVDPREAGAK